VYVMHINIYGFTYVDVQEKIMPLHYRALPSLAAARRGSRAWIEPVALLR
jgi:hypothetical protein